MSRYPGVIGSYIYRTKFSKLIRSLLTKFYEQHIAALLISQVLILLTISNMLLIKLETAKLVHAHTARYYVVKENSRQEKRTYV